MEDSIHNCYSEEDQPSPSGWDEEWFDSEDYRLGFENAMMQVKEKYELRRKKSQETTKPKASEVTIKKIPEKTSKATAESNKSAAESSGKNKDKGNQKAVLTLQLVLLIKQFLTLYIVRIITPIQPLR